MPEELLASFEVKHLSVLDENGNVDDLLMPPLSETEIRRIYESMVLARTFDERALSLQREGRLGLPPHPRPGSAPGGQRPGALSSRLGLPLFP